MRVLVLGGTRHLGKRYGSRVAARYATADDLRESLSLVLGNDRRFQTRLSISPGTHRALCSPDGAISAVRLTRKPLPPSSEQPQPRFQQQTPRKSPHSRSSR